VHAEIERHENSKFGSQLKIDGDERTSRAGTFNRHYIKEWRKHRGLNQTQLGRQMGMMPNAIGGLSYAQISRIENYKEPYAQDQIELLADVLGCSVADLLTRSPEKPAPPTELIDMWDAVSAEDRQRVIDIARVFHANRSDSSQAG
jgi:transcriptional regulator with XRE-family HTH domain